MNDMKTIADYYGLDNQLNQTMEECAELIQACNKYRRNKDFTNLVEEIADVSIMLEQLQYLLGISDCEIVCCIDRKIERQMKRIEEEKKGDCNASVL